MQPFPHGNKIQFNSIQFNSIQFNSIQFNSIQFNELVYKFLQGANLIIYTVCMTVLQNVIINLCNLMTSSWIYIYFIQTVAYMIVLLRCGTCVTGTDEFMCIVWEIPNCIQNLNNTE